MKSLAVLLASMAIAGAAHAGGAHSATLAVTNMDCATCPITVRKALERVPGVESAKVDFKAKLAIVAFDPTRTKPEALVKATTDAGYPSTVKQVQ
jgi:periplasmic mercuric ion binding protein